MEDVLVKLNVVLLWLSCIQQEEDCLLAHWTWNRGRS